MDALAEVLEKARAHKETAEYDEALELYRKIVAEAPPDFESLAAAHIEMGLVLGFTGEFDDSVAVLQQCIERWPDSAFAHLSLGKTQLMLGMYEEARAPLERTVELSETGDRHHEDACKQLDLLRTYGF